MAKWTLAWLGLKQIAEPPAGKSRARVVINNTKGPPKRVGDIWAKVTIVTEHQTVLCGGFVGYTVY